MTNETTRHEQLINVLLMPAQNSYRGRLFNNLPSELKFLLTFIELSLDADQDPTDSLKVMRRLLNASLNNDELHNSIDQKNRADIHNLTRQILNATSRLIEAVKTYKGHSWNAIPAVDSLYNHTKAVELQVKALTLAEKIFGKTSEEAEHWHNKAKYLLDDLAKAAKEDSREHELTVKQTKLLDRHVNQKHRQITEEISKEVLETVEKTLQASDTSGSSGSMRRQQGSIEIPGNLGLTLSFHWGIYTGNAEQNQSLLTLKQELYEQFLVTFGANEITEFVRVNNFRRSIRLPVPGSTRGVEELQIHEIKITKTEATTTK